MAANRVNCFLHCLSTIIDLNKNKIFVFYCYTLTCKIFINDNLALKKILLIYYTYYSILVSLITVLFNIFFTNFSRFSLFEMSRRGNSEDSAGMQRASQTKARHSLIFKTLPNKSHIYNYDGSQRKNRTRRVRCYYECGPNDSHLSLSIYQLFIMQGQRALAK